MFKNPNIEYTYNRSRSMFSVMSIVIVITTLILLLYSRVDKIEFGGSDPTTESQIEMLRRQNMELKMILMEIKERDSVLMEYRSQYYKYDSIFFEQNKNLDSLKTELNRIKSLN